jgi:hypothetical protein
LAQSLKSHRCPSQTTIEGPAVDAPILMMEFKTAEEFEKQLTFFG